MRESVKKSVASEKFQNLSLSLSKKKKKKVKKRNSPLVALVLAVVPRHHGHPRLAHQLLRPRLVPHRPHRGGRRAHPRDPFFENLLCKRRRLGEEAVARVDGRRARRGGRRQDPLDVEVGGRGRGGSQAHGLVGEGDVRGPGVGVGEDGDGGDACGWLVGWLEKKGGRERGRGERKRKKERNETAASAPRERRNQRMPFSLSLSSSFFSHRACAPCG